ncbi:MAG: hypothetical protein SH859_11155 [Hyphomicrobium aestuarii]|nr:hypothetical protein [Hyphomicrobium aestuarii]
MRVVVQLSIVVTSLAILSGVVGAQETSSGPLATEPPAPEEFVFEGLPPEIARKIAIQRADLERRNLAGNRATRGLASTAFVWPQTMPRINVCFIGGDLALRRRVVEVAMEWKTNTGAPLDFGDDPSAPRTCDPKADGQHIRVGFKRDGTAWSAIGRQSMTTYFPRDGASMNLGFGPGFPADKVRRTILHEFGHALGLEHEHQSPEKECINEFDRARLLEFLKPKGWTQDDVELQLGLLDKQGVIVSPPFDIDSIMIYGFPAKYYKKGDGSHCYAVERNLLSDGDKQLIAKLYPADNAAKTAMIEARATYMRQAAMPNVLTRGSRGGAAGETDDLLLDLIDELAVAPAKP